MASQPRTCSNCGGAIFRYNRSGYCRERACISVAMRLKLASNPELKDAHVARLLRIARDPRTTEKKRQRWLDGRFWEGSNDNRSPESRRKAAVALSATRLAWCPPHMRDRYRALTKKGLKADEARTLILEEHEVEMRRWRRSVGAEPVVETITTPSKGVLYIDRASATAAAWAGVPEIWVRSRDERLVRARWAVYLALRRGGWTPHRIAAETGMERKGVLYGLGKAEILASVPGEFSDLFRRVVAA